MKTNSDNDASGINRRRFIKIAGGACAGVSLASGLELYADEPASAEHKGMITSDSGDVTALEKRFFARGRRHQDECYNPVLNSSAEGGGLLYLKVKGTRENLVYQPASDAAEMVIAKDKYILDPCFVGDRIFLGRTGWKRMADEVGAVGRAGRNHQPGYGGRTTARFGLLRQRQPDGARVGRARWQAGQSAAGNHRER
jgi:hypothetical protein